MNKINEYFFRTLEIPENIRSLYYQGKAYTREELLEIQNKLNKNI